MNKIEEATTSSSRPTRSASSSSANKNSQINTTNKRTTRTTRKRAATKSKSKMLSPQVLQSLGPYDVLCGRCKKCYNNIGNRRFRLTITMNVQAYTIAKSKQDKRIIIQSILQSIKEEAGGRFLRPTDDGLIVVGHALRDLVSTAKARKLEEQRPLVLPSWVDHLLVSPHRGQSPLSVEIPEVLVSNGGNRHDQQGTRVKKNEDSSAKPIKYSAATNSMPSAPQNHRHDTVGSTIADIVAPSSATSLPVQQEHTQDASSPASFVVDSGPAPFLPTSNVGSSDNSSSDDSLVQL